MDMGVAVLERGAESWRFENGDPVATRAIQDLLTDLRGFDTAGVLEDEAIAGADQAGRTVVMNSDGQVLAVLTVGAGEADHWARVEGDDTVYRLPTFRVDRLFPLLDRVIPDEPSGRLGANHRADHEEFRRARHDLTVPERAFEFVEVFQVAVPDDPELATGPKHSLRPGEHLPRDVVSLHSALMEGRVTNDEIGGVTRESVQAVAEAECGLGV